MDTPIACNLTAADLPQRTAEARALGADALVGLEVSDRSAVLYFRGERERVEALVAAESVCCAFFDFDVNQSGEGVEVAIRTPEGDEPALRGLVAGVVSGWEGGLR